MRMKLRENKTLLVVAFVLCGPPLAAAQLSIAGRIAEIEILREKHAATTRPTLSSQTVRIETISLSSATTLVRVLEDAGWIADSNALALILELNGQVVPAVLPAKTTLKVVFLQGQRRWDDPRMMGERIRVTMDIRLQDALLSQVKSLRDTWDRHEGTKTLDSATRMTVEAMIDRFSFIGASLAARRHSPLRRQTLEHLGAEAKALEALLIGPRASDGADWLPILRNINDDLANEVPLFQETLAVNSPRFDPQLPVRIRTFGTPPNKLTARVYYTLGGLYREPPTPPVGPVDSVTQIGSDVTVRLQARTYMFWIAPDGQPTRPMSRAVRLPLKVTDELAGPAIVDLVFMER